MIMPLWHVKKSSLTLWAAGTSIVYLGAALEAINYFDYHLVFGVMRNPSIIGVNYSTQKYVVRLIKMAAKSNLTYKSA